MIGGLSEIEKEFYYIRFLTRDTRNASDLK